MGVKINTKKTEAMVILTEHICTCLSSDASKARMDNIYREEQRGRKVTCQECRMDLAVGSLRSHLETHHNVYTLFALRTTNTAPPVAPRHLMAVKWEYKYWYLVPGCPHGAEGRGCTTPFNLRWHFG